MPHLPRIGVRFSGALLALAVAGCQLPMMQRDDDAPLPVSRAPEGCGTRSAETPPVLRLPRTSVPKDGGGSLELAQVHTVNRPLEQAGVWTDYDDNWSLLALELGSPGARSIAVRLRESHLPPQTEIWLCSPDRRLRHGPYREATGGELWTPVVTGDRAVLQVWIPTARKSQLHALLADVYGGYR